MPVWHASVSLWDPTTRSALRCAARLERAAIRLLAGVGGEWEWWLWNPLVCVGHLRVALSPAETASLPPELPAMHDAGPSGPRRPRSFPRRGTLR